MRASQLVTFLTELSTQELRIEFAREILAKNMNFSPAWILAILHQNDQSICEFTVTHLKTLLTIVEIDLTTDDLMLLFDYFDVKKTGKVNNKQFIELLLPLNNDVLRNTVIKRIEKDMEFSLQLKYALKRLLSEILSTKIMMKGYKQIFELRVIDNFGETIDKQRIRQFLKIHGKYPTETQLTFIDKMIKANRIQGLGVRQIKQIIQKNEKEMRERCKQMVNNQILMPSSLISVISQQLSSPIRKMNPLTITSPIQNFTPIKNSNLSQNYSIHEKNKDEHYQIVEKQKNQIQECFQKIQIPFPKNQKNSPAKITQTTSIMRTADSSQNRNTDLILADHSLNTQNYEVENNKNIPKQDKQYSLNKTQKQRANNTIYAIPQKSEVRNIFQSNTSERRKGIKKHETHKEREVFKLIQSNNKLQDELSLIKLRNKQRMQRIQKDLNKFK